jgi:hypothetical protein
VAVNVIVLAVTLLMSGYAGVWTRFPRLRAWMETPKCRFLRRPKGVEGCQEPLFLQFLP